MYYLASGLRKNLDFRLVFGNFEVVARIGDTVVLQRVELLYVQNISLFRVHQE